MTIGVAYRDGVLWRCDPPPSGVRYRIVRGHPSPSFGWVAYEWVEVGP